VPIVSPRAGTLTTGEHPFHDTSEADDQQSSSGCEQQRHPEDRIARISRQFRQRREGGDHCHAEYENEEDKEMPAGPQLSDKERAFVGALEIANERRSESIPKHQGLAPKRDALL
jgi:hypothetical protein